MPRGFGSFASNELPKTSTTASIEAGAHERPRRSFKGDYPIELEVARAQEVKSLFDTILQKYGTENTMETYGGKRGSITGSAPAIVAHLTHGNQRLELEKNIKDSSDTYTRVRLYERSDSADWTYKTGYVQYSDFGKERNLKIGMIFPIIPGPESQDELKSGLDTFVEEIQAIAEAAPQNVQPGEIGRIALS